ncbi:hypothetical protein AB7W63_05580 [Providencia rettgeri]
MTQQGKNAIEIIKAVRGFEYFTTKQAQNITRIPYSTASYIISLMRKFSAVSVVGKSKGTLRYKVSPDAVQIVKREFTEVFKPESKKIDDEIVGRGMVYVEKANVQGMGSAFLKRMDSLLSEVRA